MFGFGESADAYEQVYNTNQGEPHNEGSFGHELLAGAASFAAMRMFENRQRADGQQVSHAFAKEALAAFAGAEADKIAETRGMDFVQKEEMKHKAKRQAENLYDQQYGQQEQYDPNQERHESFRRYD